jgi:hypothetical protein
MSARTTGRVPDSFRPAEVVSPSRWWVAGCRVTCLSHIEEFYTKINGRLLLVLEIELKRLGLEYSKGGPQSLAGASTYGQERQSPATRIQGGHRHDRSSR